MPLPIYLHLHRDFGGRDDRQKARLMWLVEAMGVDEFRAAIEQRMGQALRREVCACMYAYVAGRRACPGKGRNGGRGSCHVSTASAELAITLITSTPPPPSAGARRLR